MAPAVTLFFSSFYRAAFMELLAFRREWTESRWKPFSRPKLLLIIVSLEFVPLAIANVTIPHYHFKLKTTLLVGYTSTYFAYTYVDHDDVELYFFGSLSML